MMINDESGNIFYISAIFKKDVEENKPEASLFSSIPKKGGDIVNGLRPGYEYEYKVKRIRKYKYSKCRAICTLFAGV